MKNFCSEKKWAAKQQRAQQLGVENFLFTQVATSLADHLLPLQQSPRTILVQQPFPIADHFTPAIRAIFPNSTIDHHNNATSAENPYDMVIDAMTLHFHGDPTPLLIHYAASLKSGGVFQAALLGGGHCALLEQAILRAELLADSHNPATLRFFPRHQASDLLTALHQAGFQESIADSDRLTLHYQDYKKLATDFRRMGLTNSLIGLANNLGRPHANQLILTAWQKYNPPPHQLMVEVIYIHAIKK